MAQTSYSLYMQKNVLGQKADAEFDLVESFAAEGTVTFGAAVEAGTDPDQQVKIPANGTGLFRGISIYSMTVEQDADGNGFYADTNSVSVLRRGKIWVQVDTNVTIDGLAYYTYTGATAGQFGAIGANKRRVPTGVFRSTALSGAYALVEINLPGGAEAYQTFTAGTFTTAGGAAVESKVVANVLATDLVMATLKTKGATPRTILSSKPNLSGGAIDIEFSGDPSTDHVVTYQVLRALGAI